MKLLIDGDILVYRAGFACNDEPVQNALQACKMMLNGILKRCRYTDKKIYISADDKSNYRYEIAKTRPYKGNRTARKPIHYDAIRNYLVSVHNAIEVTGQEADDALGIEQTQSWIDGECRSVIVTIDKDLDQIAGWHFNFVKDVKYFIEPETADWVFYYQLLTGDPVDNILGIPGVGKVKARKLLKKCNNPDDMLKVVREAYKDDEYLTEQARLVRIRRYEGELWEIKTTT